MLAFLFASFVGVLILAGLDRLVDWWSTRRREHITANFQKAIEEYEKALPGMCYLCGWYRFGRREGYLSAQETPWHDPCPEREHREAMLELVRECRATELIVDRVLINLDKEEKPAPEPERRSAWERLV